MSVKKLTDPLPIPSEWHVGYSDEDKAGVIKIIEWINTHAKPQLYVSRLARINTSTFNSILSGRYVSPPGKHIARALDALERHDQRERAGRYPFVRTSVSDVVFAACHSAHTDGAMAIATGVSGTGKTSAAKEYARRNQNVFLVEAEPGMNAGDLLEDICAQAKVSTRGTSKNVRASKRKMFRQLVAELRGSRSLIILDEAETVQDQALEYLRRLRDKAGIGVALIGRDDLEDIIRPHDGVFDQLRSRVGFWTNPVTAITREDCDALVQAAFADQDEIPEEVMDILWAYSEGSARTLLEQLCLKAQQLGTNKGHALSPALIHKIATEVLRMKPKAFKPNAQKVAA